MKILDGKLAAQAVKEKLKIAVEKQNSIRTQLLMEF